MNPKFASETYYYGLRVSYRLRGRSDVISQDFYGTDKADASAALIEQVKPNCDWVVTLSVVPEPVAAE